MTRERLGRRPRASPKTRSANIPTQMLSIDCTDSMIKSADVRPDARALAGPAGDAGSPGPASR